MHKKIISALFVCAFSVITIFAQNIVYNSTNKEDIPYIVTKTLDLDTTIGERNGILHGFALGYCYKPQTEYGNYILNVQLLGQKKIEVPYNRTLHLVLGNGKQLYLAIASTGDDASCWTSSPLSSQYDFEGKTYTDILTVGYELSPISLANITSYGVKRLDMEITSQPFSVDYDEDTRESLRNALHILKNALDDAVKASKAATNTR